MKFNITRSPNKNLKIEANINVITDEVDLHVQFYSQIKSPEPKCTSRAGVWMTMALLKQEMSDSDFSELEKVVSKINSLIKII